MALPPLTATRLFTEWRLDPFPAVVAAVAAVAYLLAVRRATARGASWPLARTTAFLVLGVGSGVIATMSALASYRDVLFWPAAVQVSLLAMVTPVGLALGDPLSLTILVTKPATGTRLRAAIGSPLVSALTFPLLSSILAIGTQFAVYFTPFFAASLRSTAVRELLYVAVVGTGCLFTLPLLGGEFRAEWCSHPVRALIAFVDGLLDALPGLVVMTGGVLVSGNHYLSVHRTWGPSPRWDQTIGGGLMLTIAEAVGIPFIGAVFVQWFRADAREAAELDRRLDEQFGRRPQRQLGAAAGRQLEGRRAQERLPAAGEAAAAGPALDRPWWEVDPGPLSGRYGWGSGAPQDPP